MRSIWNAVVDLRRCGTRCSTARCPARRASARASASASTPPPRGPTACRCLIMLNGRIVPPRLGGYGKRWQTYRILTPLPLPARRRRRWSCGRRGTRGTRSRGSAARAACRCRRRGWRGGPRSACATGSALSRPRASRLLRDSALPSSSASAPFSQAPIGAPKPRLGRCSTSRGSTSASAFFSSAFSSPPATLMDAGICGGQLDQLVIQQRHAALERRRHRHLVGQQQQVVGHLRAGVDREHARQRIVAADALEASRRSRRSAPAVRALIKPLASGAENTPT